MRIAVVGCGKLGTRIAKALKDYEILAIRRNVSKIELECEKSSKIEDAKSCDVIILTLKPDTFREVKPNFGDRIVVSFMAGVSVEELKQCSKKVVKAMTGIFLGFVTYCCSGLSEEEKALVKTLLEKIGETFEVEERIVDISIAYSSGIAYVARLVEAATLAGIRLGMSAELSRKLAVITFLSSSKLLEIDADDVVKLVATPAGSTIEGLAKMMECKAEWCVEEAFYTAGRKFLPSSSSSSTKATSSSETSTKPA